MLDQFILLLMAFSTPSAQARVAPQCTPAPGRSAERVEGEVTRGQVFSKATSGGWILRLVPAEEGWYLAITMKGRESEDLSRLTPPWHFSPNPRHIDWWRNADNTGPNDGSVNAPQNLREFIFSPQVGREIQGPWQHRARAMRRLSGSRHSGEVGYTWMNSGSRRRAEVNVPLLSF